MFGWLNRFWMNWLLAEREAEARPLPGDRWALDTVRRYRLSSILFLIFWALLSAGIALDAWLRPEDAAYRGREAAAWFSLFLVPLGMSVFGILDAWRARVIIDANGLWFAYPWRPQVRIAWGGIRRIRYHETHCWFVVEREKGRAIRIGVARRGLGRLRRELRRHVEATRWAAAAVQMPRLESDDGWGEGPV